MALIFLSKSQIGKYRDIFSKIEGLEVPIFARMNTLIQARASKCDVNFPRMEQDFFHLDFYYRSFWPQVKIAQAKKEFGFFFYFILTCYQDSEK
jgi:hypothetical protein